MDFRFSDLIDPSTYETEGLCNDIPLRRHKESSKEDLGALRAQADWNDLVGPLEHYNGCLGPKYGWVQVMAPECLPDRLEILAYAYEFAFLYDDLLEKIDQDQGVGVDRQILEVFSDNSEKDSIKDEYIGEKRMRSQIFAEMAAIDPERALSTMTAWVRYVHLTASRPRSTPFATLKEYIPYRIIDVAESLISGTLIFGMALTIPEHEKDLCSRLSEPAFVAFSLTNDLFSWEKERDAAKREGVSNVINAIWVIMGEQSMTELEAKAECREKIKEYVAESVRVVAETRGNLNISLDVRIYIEALLYMISGNLVWSIYCPRYHPEVSSYNDAQLSMKEEVRKRFTFDRPATGPVNGYVNGHVNGHVVEGNTD